MKFLIISILILLPLPIFAQEQIEISCPTNIGSGEQVECAIMAKADYEVSAIEFHYSFDTDSLEKIAFIPDSTWEGNEENNIILLYTDENKKDKFALGVLKFQVKKNLEKIDINQDSIAFYDSNFTEHLIQDESVNKIVNSESNKLSENNNKFKYGIICIVIIILLGFIIRYIYLNKKKNGVV